MMALLLTCVLLGTACGTKKEQTDQAADDSQEVTTQEEDTETVTGKAGEISRNVNCNDADYDNWDGETYVIKDEVITIELD